MQNKKLKEIHACLFKTSLLYCFLTMLKAKVYQGWERQENSLLLQFLDLENSDPDWKM